MPAKLRLLLGAFIAVVGGTSSARAQAVWTGLGGNMNYTTGANWSGGVIPVNNGTQNLNFPIPSGGYVVNLIVNESVNSILFSGVAGTSQYVLETFSGASLTIGSGGISTQNTINSYSSFDVPIVLSASQIWDGTQGYVVAYQDISETG